MLLQSTLTFAIVLFFNSILLSQKEYDLKVRSTFLGYGFKQGKVKLSIDNIQSILRKNNDYNSIKHLKEAKKQMNSFYALGTIGAIALGYQFGDMFINLKSPNYRYIGLSSASMFVGFLSRSYARDNLEKVVDRYNQNRIGIGATESGGFGLTFKF